MHYIIEDHNEGHFVLVYHPSYHIIIFCLKHKNDIPSLPIVRNFPCMWRIKCDSKLCICIQKLHKHLTIRAYIQYLLLICRVSYVFYYINDFKCIFYM
jgi:hypothetical protein